MPLFRGQRVPIAVLCCAAAAICWSGMAHAQTETAARLTLSDALKQALGVKATLKEAVITRDNAASRLRSAGVNVTASAGAVSTLDDQPMMNGLSARTFGSLTWEGLGGQKATAEVSPWGQGQQRAAFDLSVRQPLTRGSGKLSERYDRLAGARNDLQVQEKQLYLTRQSTVLAVVEAYFNAVLAREQVAVQEEAVRFAESAAQRARDLDKYGMVLGIDLTRAEVRVAQAQDQLNGQRRQYRDALDRLMLAIGAGVGQTPELVDTVPTGPLSVPDINAAIDLAIQQRAELFRFDRRMDDQRRAAALAQDQMRASIDAVASWRAAAGDEGFMRSSMLKNDSTSIGIQVNVPLDQRIIRENRDVAKRNLSILTDLRAYQVEQILNEVRAAYRALDAARTTLNIYTDNLKVAQQNLDIATQMEQEGLTDNRNLLEAQQALVDVNSNIISARARLYLASVNVYYAMGDDVLRVLNLQ